MAIAGSGTSAYQLTLVCVGNELKVVPKTTQRSLCASPVDAVAELRKGGTVIVAGSDMVEVRRLLEGEER